MAEADAALKEAGLLTYTQLLERREQLLGLLNTAVEELRKHVKDSPAIRSAAAANLKAKLDLDEGMLPKQNTDP